LSPTGLIAVIVDDLRRRRSPRGAPGGLEASHAEMRLHVVGASSEVVARERRVTHEAGSGRRRDFDAQASVAGAVIGTGRRAVGRRKPRQRGRTQSREDSASNNILRAPGRDKADDAECSALRRVGIRGMLTNAGPLGTRPRTDDSLSLSCGPWLFYGKGSRHRAIWTQGRRKACTPGRFSRVIGGYRLG
jgi:hypothetical protein